MPGRVCRQKAIQQIGNFTLAGGFQSRNEAPASRLSRRKTDICLAAEY